MAFAFRPPTPSEVDAVPRLSFDGQVPRMPQLDELERLVR